MSGSEAALSELLEALKDCHWGDDVVKAVYLWKRDSPGGKYVGDGWSPECLRVMAALRAAEQEVGAGE